MNEALAGPEMNKMFEDAWKSQAASIVGYIPEIRWQGVEFKDTPDLTKAYVRVTDRHIAPGGHNLGGRGSTRYTRYGIVFIQVYVPLSLHNHLTFARGLGRIARDAYEGRSSPGGVWFRNCRMSEIGPTDGWFQVNVTNDFTYDEVK